VNMAYTAKDEKVYTNCTVGGPLRVYVKNGKMTHVEPLELGPDDAESWVIEARGRKFSPSRVAKLSEYALTERSRNTLPTESYTLLKEWILTLKETGIRKTGGNRGMSESVGMKL